LSNGTLFSKNLV